jgi:phosphatidylserine/phosphatidylglycerophosphate/cardiolipin synthase-like enzyme
LALILVFQALHPGTASGREHDLRGNSPADQFEIPRTLPAHPGTIQLLADSDYYPTLTTLIQGAVQSIDLAMFLFKAAGNNRPAMIAEELIKARKRGVRVRVILENSGYDQKLNQANNSVAEKLKKNQVTVEFDSPKRTAHAKIVVIDRRYCLVGSHNLTESALRHNHEFSLLIDSRPLARELLDYMEGLRTEE